MIATSALLAGCATALPNSTARMLPQLPVELAQRVPAPRLYKGEDARAALRLTRSALGTANRRIVDLGAWYTDVRKDYTK